MPSLADKIIAKAESQVGLAESPPGSNRGPVKKYGAIYGAWMDDPPPPKAAQPWCAAFRGWLLKECGVPGWQQLASPSTAIMCERARANGWVCEPKPGAAVVWCGKHVETLVEHIVDTIWATIGGNTGDAVRHRIRDIAGAVVYSGMPDLDSVVPAPPAKVQFWFRDTHPELARSRPYATKAERDAEILKLSPDWQRRASRWHMEGVGYGYTIGSRVLYGPFKTQAGRNAARKRVATTYNDPSYQLVAFRSERQADGTRKTFPPQPVGTLPLQAGGTAKPDTLGKTT